ALGERLGAPCAGTTSMDTMCFGGQSFHFGDPELDLNDNVNYDFPGGAHGSIISDPFSLSGYSQVDAPVLYFNYYLVTEEAQPVINPITGQITQPKRDAFRVYIADESAEDGRGVWHLLATNDPMDMDNDFIFEDEGYSFDADPNDNIDIEVQPLWDNTWQDVPRLRRPQGNPGPTVPD